MARTTSFFLVAVIFLSAGWAFGHPPSSLELEFKLSESLLTMTAYHAVRDSTKHYVDRVVVKLNGDKIIEQKFASQLNSDMKVVKYTVIDADAGDEIEVTAGCNISGQEEESIIVEKPIEEEPEAPSGEEEEI